MHTRLSLLLALVTVAGCQCSPETPTPVTIRVKNGLRGPIFVDATAGLLGVTLEREVGGEWFPFDEAPACECLSCDLVCAGCDCVRPTQSQVVKLLPGDAQERTWAGQVQVQGAGSCSSSLLQGPDCVRAENPGVDEEFQARLCFSQNVQGANGADAGVPVRGFLLDAGVQCVTQRFRPADGVVELSPARGAACSESVPCVGADDLCFEGECTASCPANGFPVVGGTWQVSVDEPDDQGFFVVTQQVGETRWQAQGRVSSVRYDNGVMKLQLARANPGGGELRGTVFVTLPGGLAVPFTVDEELSVLVLDKSAPGLPARRGVVVRDAQGTLLLVADVGLATPVLKAADTTPFAVQQTGIVIGCDPDLVCGKILHQVTRIAGGPAPVDVKPGQTFAQTVGGQSYKFLNAANYRFSRADCEAQPLMPYAILNERVAP